MSNSTLPFDLPDGAVVANSLAVTGGITTDNLSVTANVTKNEFYASPSTIPGPPSFRAIVSSDLPVATTSLLGVVSASTGLTISSGALSVSYGTIANTAVQGNDTRLSSGAALTGGSIDNVTIGSTTSASAHFTTLNTSSSTSFGGTVNLNSNTLTGLATPVNPLDAVNLSYVSSLIQGIDFKPTAVAATTTALPASTYANGTSGVGATITATSNGVLVVDGYSVQLNDLILVKNQASAFQNGLYVCTQAGASGATFVLTRSVDMDSSLKFSGAFIPVDGSGTVNTNTLWLCNPPGTVTVGTTSIPLTQLNAATSVIAGTGITIVGTTISVNTTLAALGTTTLAANTIPYYTSSSAAGTTSLTSVGISLIGQTSIANVLSYLSLTVGTNVQAYSTTLNALSGALLTANTLIYLNGSSVASNAAITTLALSLLADTTTTSMQSTLGLVIGTNVQAYNTNLAAIAATSVAANTLIYFTSSVAATTTSLTSTGISLIGSANAAAGALVLGVGATSTATFGSIQNTPIGSTTPNTIVGTTITCNSALIIGSFTTSSISISGLGTSATLIDSWSNSTYRSVTYIVQVSQASGGTANTFMLTDVDVLCDGTNTYTSESGTINSSGSRLVNLSVTFSSGNVNVYALAVAGTVNVYILKNLIGI